MNVLRNALLWASQNRWIEAQFRKRSFARRATSRFMPGEDYASALAVANDLAADHINGIVTYLGENLTALEEADGVVRHYIEVLDSIKDLGLDVHISVKLTHLGLDLDPKAATRNLNTLTAHAESTGNFVWVDMEASQYVDATLDAYRLALDTRENVGICLQAYLYRTANDLTDLLDRNGVIRLVKGAYNEPPSIAFPKKSDVDANYLVLAERMAAHPRPGGPLPALATHDIELINEIRRRADATDGARYEIDMLFGIRKNHQLQLAASGVPTRVLISYGEAWFAWYMRRLAERPANLGFVFRTMFG